ncbi:MAG: NUDIX hydrolase [Zavarzinella sp.]
MAKKKLNYSYEFPRPGFATDIVLITLERNPRVLLIQRNAEPFAGMWALPGGFVEENERIVDAARRELQEETGLTGIELEQLHTFGDPGRDPRGWSISVAYLARVHPKLLKPKAGDDASAAEWHPLRKLPPLAFDHHDIIQRAMVRMQDRADG